MQKILKMSELLVAIIGAVHNSSVHKQSLASVLLVMDPKGLSYYYCYTTPATSTTTTTTNIIY